MEAISGASPRESLPRMQNFHFFPTLSVTSELPAPAASIFRVEDLCFKEWRVKANHKNSKHQKTNASMHDGYLRTLNYS